MNVGSDQEARVDNENNKSKSIFEHIEYSYKVGVYIYESESIAIRNRNISEYGLEHRKAVCDRKGNTGMLCRNTGQEQEQELRTGTGTETKLEMVILRSVLVIPEFECGTKFRESWDSV